MLWLMKPRQSMATAESHAGTHLLPSKAVQALLMQKRPQLVRQKVKAVTTDAGYAWPQHPAQVTEQGVVAAMERENSLEKRV